MFVQTPQKVFLVLCEEQNWDNAVLKLGLSQNMLNAEIKKLEKSIGTLLIDRTNKEKVTLTGAGKLYLQNLKHIYLKKIKADENCAEKSCGNKEEYSMQKIYLWDDEKIKTAADRPSITFFSAGENPAPAVLVIPGGGYGNVCESTEGSPIARKFNEIGYHAFVLDYRTAPEYSFPAPQLDAMRAMKIIRAGSKKWRIEPRRVYSCGFSAGAHLAGSLGIICDDLKFPVNDEYDEFSHVPDAMILCYGVLAFEDWSHMGTQMNLLGELPLEERRKYSLAANVGEKTPPAFVWHTICDQVVPFRNSIEFANAMAEFKRPCELALFYWGDHGMLSGTDTLDVSGWMMQADAFLKSLSLAESDPAFRERYTNKYQSAVQH